MLLCGALSVVFSVNIYTKSAPLLRLPRTYTSPYITLDSECYTDIYLYLYFLLPCEVPYSSMSHQSSHAICPQLRPQFKHLLDIGGIHLPSNVKHIQLTCYIATWRPKKTGTPPPIPTLPRSAKRDGLWRYLWLCLWPPWSPALLKRSSLGWHMLIRDLLFIMWCSSRFMCCFLLCMRSTGLDRYHTLHR